MTKKKSKKFLPDGQVKRGRIPKKGELFAVVMEMSGGSRMSAMCEDNKTRMVRIGGKFKKRMWCRVGDLILIKPWIVQQDTKSDLVYRYLPAERNWMIRKNKIPKELNIW